VLNLETIH